MESDTPEYSHGELLAVLGLTLDQAYTQAAERAVTPPWAQIQAGMGRARRRHRRRIALQITATVLAVAGVSVGVGAVVHQPPTRAERRPATRGASVLDDGHTRGSLGSNTTWLSALRKAVSAGVINRNGDVHPEGPPAPKDVDVLFAGDVGSYRLAVVEYDQGQGAFRQRRQTVYKGLRGAAVDHLVESVPRPAKSVVVWTSDPINDPPGSHTVIFALAAAGNRVQLREPPTIDAAAKVTANVRTLTGDDDVYTAILTQPGRYGLVINKGIGRVVYGSTTDRGVNWIRKNGDPINPPVVEALPPARGGALPKGNGLETLATETFDVSWQTSRPGEFRVLAIEPAGRDTGANPVRAVVGQVTLPGGARVLVTGEQTTPTTKTATPKPGAATTGPGERDWSWLDTAQLLPAGNSDALSVAWRVPANDVTQEHRTTGWTAAMGPVGTQTVQWVHRDGSVSSGPAENTLAVTGTADVTSVRFLGAGGQQLGTAAVLDPPWSVAKVPTSPEVTTMIPAIEAVTGERPQF